MKQRISRRSFVRLGATGLGAAIPLGVAGERLIRLPQRQRTTPAHNNAAIDQARDAATDAALQQLVSPVAVGTRLGGVSVAAIGVDRRGIGVVTVVDAQGQHWHAELARRTSDDEGLNPIALSRNYSVYLRNGGSGSTPTDQHVGRAVLAIARNVKRNEDARSALQLASRSEFWAATGYKPARA